MQDIFPTYQLVLSLKLESEGGVLLEKRLKANTMKNFLRKVTAVLKNFFCAGRRKETFQTVFVILVLATLSILTYHKLFFSTGIIAREDMTFAFDTHHFYRILTRSFYPWQSALFLGHYEPMFSGTLFFKLTMIPLMMIFPATDAAVVWLVLTLLFSGISMYYMVYRLSGKRRAGFVSAILYMYNPWILERILSGHITILIGYIVVPLFMILFIESLSTSNRLQAVKAGLIFALLMFIEMRVAWLAFILMTLYFASHLASNILKKSKPNEILFLVKDKTSPFFIVIGLGFLLNAFWIVPYLNYLSTHAAIYPSTLPTVEYAYGYSSKADIANVARMSGYWLAHFEKIVRGSFDGNTELLNMWFFLGFSLAALAFITFLLNLGNRKYSASFALMALVGIFLGKGANEPFGFIYVWAFEHTFAGLFHEPNRFVYLVSFSYAFLIGVGVASLSDILQEKLLGTACRSPVAGFKKKCVGAFPVMIVCLLILGYSWPMLTGDFYGELSRVEYPEEYKDLDSWLAAQNGDYRVLFLPPWYFTKYDWLPMGYDNIREHLIVYPAKPVVALGYGDLSDRFTRFVLWSLYHNKTAYAGKLLSLLGVRYIVLRTDASDLVPDEFNTTDLRFYVLPHLQGIREVWRRNHIIVYENSFYCPHFVASQNTTAVAGDRRILTSLSFVESYRPELYPMIFMGQIDRETTEYILNKTDLIIVQDNKIPDMVFSLLEETHFIKPWMYTQTTTSFQGAWVSSSRVYSKTRLEEPLAETDSWVITNASGARLNMPFVVASDGRYDIWVKLFFGSSGYPNFNAENNITLVIDNIELVTNIRESIEDQSLTGFMWFRIASSFMISSKEHVLSLVNRNGISIVSRIAVVPKGAFDEHYEHLLDIVEQTRPNMLYLLEAESSFQANGPWKLSTIKGIYSSNSLSLLYEGKDLSTDRAFEKGDTISGKFHVIKPNMHMIALRMANDDSVDLTITIDKKNYNMHIPRSPDFGYYYLGPVYLDLGRHQINISANQRVHFDQAVIYSVPGSTYTTLDEFFMTYNYASVSYNEMNPSQYEIDTGQIDTSMLLVFLESYDVSWKAYYNNEQLSPVIIYSYANGFFVDKVKLNGPLTVCYLGYNYQLTGIIISTFSLFTVLAYLLISYHINKKRIDKNGDFKGTVQVL